MGGSEVINRLQPVAQELLAAWCALPRRDGVPLRGGFRPDVGPSHPAGRQPASAGSRGRMAHAPDRHRDRAALGQDADRPQLHRHHEPGGGQRRRCANSRRSARSPAGHGRCGTSSSVSGRGIAAETLRLPLRAADGSVSLILSASGELSGRFLHEPDKCREVITVIEQRFLDIGAGVARLGLRAEADRGPVPAGELAKRFALRRAPPPCCRARRSARPRPGFAG